MTEQTDVQLAVTAWLRADAPEHARSDVLRDTLDLVATTSQDRGFANGWVGRKDDGRPRARWMLAAGLAATLGAGLVLGTGAILRAPDLPRPEASAMPAPSSVVVPSADVTSPSYPVLPGTPGELEPGTYQVSAVPGLHLLVTVPAGWFSGGGASVWTPGDLPSRAPTIQFRTALNVYIDPCRREAGLLDPPIGPSVDAFVDALVREPGRGATGPARDIRIGRFSGKEVELRAPDDTSTCTMGDFRPWVAPGDIESGHGKEVMGPGQRDLLWVLDVDGTRVVIDVRSFSGMPAEALIELEGVRDSIVIDR